MNRRSLLQSIVPKTKTNGNHQNLAPPNGTLNPYTGPWTKFEAAHLLRRCVYGPTNEEIKAAVQNGFEFTLQTLMEEISPAEPPVHYVYEDDPDAAIGESWVNGGYYLLPGLQNARNNSLVGWQTGLMMETNMSIREKMVLFWHNHFVVANVVDGRFIYKYINSIRTNALGNFKTLTKQMVIDPSMLRYLNGNQNSKQAPNENFARELLELFTVGKGELSGPGDYTTFTEADVEAMAKVLTGWRDYGYNNIISPEFGSTYIQNRHDTTDKQLSHRFNNTLISNNNEEEYKDLIDVIFESDEVALFLARKLYRWFVFYEITEEIESNIIEPLAQLLRDNDYEVKPAVEALLGSEHFFEADNIGCMIKNPLDHLLGVFNQFEVKPQPILARQYALWTGIYNFSAVLQMQMFAHPSVAGWKAYYQSPSYYQIWISSVTLPLRTLITDAAATVGFSILDEMIKIEPLPFIAKFENPLDINELLQEMSQLLYPKLLKDNQFAALKEILIPGLPDFEWTVEYADYIADPDDPIKKLVIDTKLRGLLLAMFKMPEYHLS